MLIQNLSINPFLVWHDKKERLSHFDFETVQSKETKIYKGILFCFYDDRLEILFRPHYFKNDNLHNADDFTALQSIAVFTEFINTFDLWNNMSNLRVVNIEFGLNVISPVDCKDLITFLSYHQLNEFRSDTNLAYSKKSFTATRQGTANKYKIIKAYSKGIHQPTYCDPNTFRWEIKSKEAKYIRTAGVETVADLLRYDTYKDFAVKLQREWREVLILGNNQIFDGLTHRENTQLNKYLNPHNWYKVKQQHRNQFSKTKKRYLSLLDKTDHNIHSEMGIIIAEKLTALLQKGADSTPNEYQLKGADSTIDIYRIRTHEDKRKCPVTGLSLEHETEGALYARTSTLTYFRQSEPATFALIKIYLVRGCSTPKFEQSEIKHLAKQIRNRYYNSFKIKRVGYNQPPVSSPNQITLTL